MRVEELRDQLDDLAGPAHPATRPGIEHVHRVARRQRRNHVGIAASIIVVVLAVTGTLLLRSGQSGPRVVAPADTTPTTTMPPPPSVDPKTLFDQPRVPVSDEHGKTRGTIPTAAYKAAMGITEDGAPPPTQRSNTPVPVIDDNGNTTGYWIPTYGFVERSVVEVPGFDPDAFTAQKEAEWKAANPEAAKRMQERIEQLGNAEPTTTTTP